MKILVAEDDFASRTTLVQILKDFGSCDAAANGKEAVDAVQTAYEAGEPYNLLCLDIMMPELDGQEVLKRIRKMEADQSIHVMDQLKVIIVSALGDRNNVMQAFRSGAESYLVKPILKDKVVEELQKLELIESNAG